MILRFKKEPDRPALLCGLSAAQARLREVARSAQAGQAEHGQHAGLGHHAPVAGASRLKATAVPGRVGAALPEPLTKSAHV